MSLVTNDRDLLNQLRAGDERALDTLFETWYGYLYKIAFSILCDADAAKDAVQEVFIRFWQKRAEIEVKNTLKGYLQRAVINQCLAVLRQQKSFSNPAQQHNLLPDPSPSASDQLQADSLQRLVNAAINRLPEQCRLIFRLSRFEELSHREIAEQLELSPKTIENQIGKALKILREELGPWLTIFLPTAVALIFKNLQ